VSRHGVRTSWDAVPAPIRERVEDVVDARIRTAINVDGGFSPGPAARCELSDGRTVFVKAAGLALNPITPEMHRREAAVLAAMPTGVPAPRLIGVVDDGDWVAVVIEWIDGRMPLAPLAPHDVDRILRVVDRLAQIKGPASLQPCFEQHPGLFGHWRRLAEHPLSGLDDWTLEHLPRLVELEADVEQAVKGDRLVHLDLRTDNVIFADPGEEHDVVVDWPHACLGPPWADLVALLPSLELDGGPPCEQVFIHQRVSVAAPFEEVNAWVAAIAGYLTRMSLLPPPPGLPTVRAFQAAQATVTRRWLAERCGWEPR
jgi:Ser/Thr protein kinase RdoA (MazF antagonist)